MIRMDAIWLTTEPTDLHASAETALAKVVAVQCREATLRLSVHLSNESADA